MVRILVSLFAITLIALIAHPPCRSILFPPVPVALVDSKSGDVRKPKSGVLGSHDGATGALESHKGKAIEAEADNVVNDIASVALSSATGKHSQSEPPPEGAPHDLVPGPTAIAVGAANAKGKTAGVRPLLSMTKPRCRWRQQCGLRRDRSCMASQMSLVVGSTSVATV